MTEKRYAILIASSKYPDEPGLTTLRCPENDVDAVNEILSSPAFGQFTETFVFKNKPSHEVLEQIETVLHDAGKGLVLIYFSGHGKLNPSGQLCLATANTKLRALGSTSIPVERIKSFFDHSNVSRKILLLDCCYSGAVGKDFAKGGVDDQLQLMSHGHGTFIMTASTSYQTALEKEGDQYGLFTKHLVEGITSGDADKNDDGFVDMHELYEYVHEKVRAEGAQEPMKWDINAKGEMIIACSGKESREQRIKEAKKKLYEFAAQEVLTDSIVSEAVKIISIPEKDRSSKENECSLLVGQLISAKIRSADFIERWMRTCYARDDVNTITKKGYGNMLFAVLCVGAVVYFFLPNGSDSNPVKESASSVSVVTKPKQGDTMKDDITGMEFVYVPGGCFKMGSSTDDKDHQDEEGPVHEVCVDGFWMGKYEVTQGQWQKITGENPSYFKKGSNYPVEKVSWNETKTFIDKLNSKSGKQYRLPTEAEWEYACRANGSGKYCGSNDLDAVAWFGEGLDGSTHSVGQKQKNAFGLYDMSGNVWEWCADWYGKDYYASSPKNNPQGPESSAYRVLRGGSYFSTSLFCRAVDRFIYPPEGRYDYIGFRLVLPFQ